MSMLVITETMLPDGPAGARPGGAPSVLAPAAHWYEPVKVVFEFVAAALLLLLTGPLIFLAMIVIRLTSPGPVVYTQTRLGRNGKPFTIYKLRSMTHDCESLTGAQWSKPGDTRVTSVGRWLRKSHIDELPQLWNVLRGDMGLVGPRPERPEFLPMLEQAIPHYRQRLHVRPGLTGFAQVQLPPDSDLESVRIKLAYDVHYVRHLSLFFDAALYLATLGKLLGLSEELIRTLCRLPKRDAVESEYQKLATPVAALVAAAASK
jgi:lipopolysaccharide/colanic/teichoic acid biosynthesis glycosyltransferase